MTTDNDRSEPNVIMAQPCSWGGSSCPAIKTPCTHCTQACWLSRKTKRVAEALHEPYIVMCFLCCAKTLPPEDLENIFVGGIPLNEAIRTVLSIN